MTAWMIALLALLPPFGLAVLLACRGDPGQRFAAFQLAGTAAVSGLVLLCFATDEPSFADLPLALVLLNVPGTLLFGSFLERWL